MKWIKSFFQQDGFNPQEVEHSGKVRIFVFLTVVIAILASIQATESPLYIAVASIGLTTLGFWISWKRKEAKNWWIKLILALLMLLALSNFMLEISQNPYDARIPLSILLIWLQVLHSYDLPRRKDVFYSLWVGLILISVAATVSRDVSFGIYLAIFVVLSLLCLFLSHLSSQKVTQVPLRFWSRLFLPSIVLSLVATTLSFFFIPRYQGLRIQSFPVSMKIPDIPFFNGEIRNRAYPNRSSQGAAGDGSDKNQKRQRGEFDPNAYYGFSTELDLNYRGKLSDEIVMRVKSSQPQYWRGMAFDLYDGQMWKMTYPFELKRIERPHLPLYIRETAGLKKNIAYKERITSTFYIERDQSNLIFKSTYAEQLYFPTSYVLLDIYGSLRSPIELFQGTTYSMISLVPQFYPKDLRQISFEAFRTNPASPIYYQIPQNLTPRVRDLSQSLVKNAKTPYDAVMAVHNYLKTHFPYNLDIPEFPQDRDTIDYFIFEQKAGYCEHFASAMAIMLRQVGFATRLVTGYNSGAYNPITGYFDVRSNDAHGWVEVYFPHFGWVPFDPTPGYAAYQAEPSIYDSGNTQHFSRFFGDLIPQSIKDFMVKLLEIVLGWFGQAFGFLGLILTFFSLTQWTGMIAGLIGIVSLFVFVKSRQQKQHRETPEFWVPQFLSDQDKKRFALAYLSLLELLEEALAIGPDGRLTPQERISRLNGLGFEVASQLQSLNDFYYRLRYSSYQATPQLLMENLAIIEALNRKAKALKSQEQVV